MFYLYFLTQLTLIWILSPIRWIVNFTSRFLWKNFKFDISLFETAEDLGAGHIQEKVDEIHRELKSKIDKIKQIDDGAKFISIWLIAYPDDDVYKLFKSYIKDGKFYRKPDKTTKKAFSGDMFAGYSYALSILNRAGSLDDEFKQEVIRVLENSLYERPYLQLKSHSETNDRGYLLRWFFFNAGHFLPILTVLSLLYNFTGKFKYKALYLILLPVVYLDILVYPTFFIRIGKFRYAQWYYVHSNYLYYWTLYSLTRNNIYRYGARFIKKRFWFNPEFTDNRYIIGRYLIDYAKRSKKPETIDIPKNRVYNIKNLIRRKPAEYEEYEYIVPPRFRKNDYQWEKALDRAEWKEHSVLSGIDFIRLWARL